MIPATPAIQALFNDPAFWAALQDFAPKSPYTGQPLTLVDRTPHDGYGKQLRITGPRNAEWQNDKDPEWWQGDTNTEKGKIRDAVKPKEVALAALRMNVLTVDVGRELETWTAANKTDPAEVESARLAEAKWEFAHQYAEVKAARELHWKSVAAETALREFPGEGNRAARTARRAEIEAKFRADYIRDSGDLIRLEEEILDDLESGR